MKKSALFSTVVFTLLLFVFMGTSQAVDYTLTVTAPVNGSVTGNGIDCPATTCTASIDEADSVTLTASGASGYEFDNWTGDLSGSTYPSSNSVKFDMGNNPRNVKANFQKITYNLTTTTSGGGTVETSPSGQTTYNFDDGLGVVAKPDAGWKFVGWTGAGSINLMNSSIASTTIIKNTYSDTDVTATFEKITYYLTTTSSGGGTVTGDPTYVYNQNLAVTAAPAPPAVFMRWEGDTGNLDSTPPSPPPAATHIKNPTYNNTTLNAVFGYPITATSAVHIPISPAGTTNVEHGTDQAYTFSPAAGFCVDKYTVDTTPYLGYATGYTFTNVTDSHNISVTERTVYTVTGNIEPEAVRNIARWQAIDSDTGNAFTGWLAHGQSANIPCDVNNVKVVYNTITCWDKPGDSVPSSPQSASNNTIFTGTYTVQHYDLVLAKFGTGDGTVSANPGGTGVGTYSITCGDTVDLIATHDVESDFINWIGNVDDPLNYSTTVTMYKDESVTAVFDKVQYVLSISASGDGTVSPSAGQHTYNPDVLVNVIATPDANWTFKNWIGDVADINSQSTSVMMNSDKTVTALFTASSNPDVDNDGDGYTESGNGANPGVDCNDNNANIYPGATEICGDGLDQDCNGSDATCADDLDGDGFGAVDDCNNLDATIYPGASEICEDGIIQDCNRVAAYCQAGETNTDSACITAADPSCNFNVQDQDTDGYSPSVGDCDDSVRAIHPGATDICGDGIDQDCYDGDRLCDTPDTCITISDKPLNSEITVPRPNIMFLLDDSGSMDWSYMMAGGGVFRGLDYFFDSVGDNTYKTSYPIGRSERRFWESQWKGVSKLWYDPTVEYFPWADQTATWDPTRKVWPQMADADIDYPRSDPTKITPTFDFSTTTSDPATPSYTTLYEPGGQRVTITRDINSNRSYTVADALRVENFHAPSITQVSGGNDDAEQPKNDTSKVNINSIDLDMGGGTDNMKAVGIRFAHVNLPADYTPGPSGNPIIEATITFVSASDRANKTNLLFEGHASGDSGAFEDIIKNITDRTKTTASKNLSSVSAWTEGNSYTSPNLNNIVNEIIARPDWVDGNALTFIVTGTGSREARSLNNSSPGAPILTLKTATSTGVTIELDNTDAEFMWNGSWTYGTDNSAIHPTTSGERYYRTSKGDESSDPDNTATWVLNIDTAGFYNLYTYSPDRTNNDRNALYTVYYDGGSHSGTLRVNQNSQNAGTESGNGGLWYKLVKTTTLSSNVGLGTNNFSVADMGEVPHVGAIFTVDGDPTRYIVSSATATTMTFVPGLANNYTTGDTIEFLAFWYMNKTTRDAEKIHRTHYYRMSTVKETTVAKNYISGWTSKIEVVDAGGFAAGDLVILGDRPGYYRLKSGTTSTLLKLTRSVNVNSNTLPIGEDITIVRPYLLMVDTHDITGTDLGATAIQYYRYQDDNWDGTEDVGEGNNRVDYQELTRVTSPPADLIPKKNYLRTIGAAVVGSTTLTLESSGGVTITVGSTFTAEGDTTSHTISAVTGNVITFTPGLGSAVAVKKKVTFDDESLKFIRSVTEERQNIANWYQFFRRREFTAKAAVGRVIAEMDNVNIGIHTIHSRLNQVVLPVKPKYDPTTSTTCTIANNYCDSTDDLLTALYSTYSSGGTPLRSGLESVGQYFDATDSSGGFATGATSPYLPTADGGACQQSFAIMMTDGYYNGALPDLDAGVNRNADGDNNSMWDGGVYADTADYSLADVAMRYYEKDLSSSLADQVPKSQSDHNSAQHMVTYSVAFGVRGNLPPDPPVNCPPDCSWPTTMNNQGKIDDLFHAAVNGRGDFISASNPQELVDALLGIKNDIELKIGSGAAVGITPTGQLTTESVIFQATYDSNDWSGDISAYHLVTQAEYLADQRLPTPMGIKVGQVKFPKKWSAEETMKKVRDNDQNWWHDTSSGQLYIRQVVSYNGTKGVSFVMPADPANPTGDELTIAQLGSLEASTALQAAKISYHRGDSTNEQPNGEGWRGRGGQLFGDFIHSSPQYVTTIVQTAGGGDGIDNDNDGSTDEKGEEEAKILIGSNDGGLHVFNADDKGKELLFYLPAMLLKNLDELSVKNPLYNHKYFVDNVVNVRQLGYDDADPVLAVGALGKGGKGYYAINVSKIAGGTALLGNESKAADIIKWEYPNANLTDDAGNSLADINGYMGYSYSKGLISRSNAANTEWMVVFGNGYESTSGKAVLILLGLNADMSIKWRKEINTGVGDPTIISPNGSCNGLATPILIDGTFDGKVDYGYAGDLLGNVWKFDLSDTDPDNWHIAFEDTTGTKQPLFTARGAVKSASGWSATIQPITTQPEVIEGCGFGQKGDLVIFGTGRYLQSGEFNDTSIQTIYGVWDWSASFSDSDDKKHSYLGEINIPSEEKPLLDPTYVRTVSNWDTTPVTRKPVRTGVTSQGLSLLQQTQITGAADPALAVYRILSNNKVNWYDPISGEGEHIGWYFDLPGNGEKMVTELFVRGGFLRTVTVQPTDSFCSSGTLSIIHAIDACSGGRTEEPFYDTNNDGKINAADLFDLGNGDLAAVTGIYVQGMAYAPATVSVGDGTGLSVDISTVSDATIKTTLTKDEKHGVVNWREIQ